jgi:SOS response associated peptidase (SRAP)
MCGRYVIISTPEAIRALFGYGEQSNFPPRYNVAPTQPIPIVRLADGKRSFALMRWGLLPSWVKDPKTFPLLINARGESVLDKPAFRNAMRRRRCLIPTDGFYEWQVGTPKRPYFVRSKRGADGTAPPLAFRNLDRTERRGDRHRGDHHDHGEPHAVRHSRSHADFRAAGRFRPVARLRQCRSRCRGSPDRAGERCAA